MRSSSEDSGCRALGTRVLHGKHDNNGITATEHFQVLTLLLWCASRFTFLCSLRWSVTYCLTLRDLYKWRNPDVDILSCPFLGQGVSVRACWGLGGKRWLAVPRFSAGMCEVMNRQGWQLKSEGGAVKTLRIIWPLSIASGLGARPHLHIGPISFIPKMLHPLPTATTLCWLRPDLPDMFDHVAP